MLSPSSGGVIMSSRLSGIVSSWSDLQVARPLDPRSCILNATLGSTSGTFLRSTNALESSWGSPSTALTGANTKLVSLDTTDAATTAEAAQWTLLHQMVNVAANMPPAFNKVIYCRAGGIWDNQIE